MAPWSAAEVGVDPPGDVAAIAALRAEAAAFSVEISTAGAAYSPAAHES